MAPDSFERWEREFNETRRNEQQFMDWLKMGLSRKWVTPPLCLHHDPVPLTRDEVEAIDADDPPCIYYVRVLAVPTLGLVE
jgi:hypothetical protein